ncbi:hypothetical protein C7974DRAFT_383097 [Boeremia exigua]|uniref:uncharacterized protein n=1 Tax=Boeremia exigua TaxID=749465 RepID=UPI001E8E36E8|nr:uncharacterized protein C7974DRAFT_383097 [Boeremia exigua]KAH6644196.1 hypothetical protein C7974DRAFT_383097 [Boeremia exigua]
MYRAIPKYAWERPLDMNVRSTNEGELHIPFSHFVRPTIAKQSSRRDFPQFLQLPTELQFRILSFCDNQTLFSLMHTSSHVRSEANRRFFSCTDTWYCIDATWIHKGCFPGDAPYDMQFLQMVEQLEVQFSSLEEDYWLWNHHVTGDTFGDFQYGFEDEKRVAERVEQCFYDFWQRLHACFPRIVRVMIQCNNFLRPLGSLTPEAFKGLARMCGRNTEVSLSLLKTSGRRDRRAERSIWHQSPDTTTSDVTDKWKEGPNELEPRILLPVKRFRGPLGAYEYSKHKRLQYFRFQNTIVVMLIAAIEREHFCGHHSPFQCTAPRCSVIFNHPGEFTTHVINHSEHREHITAPEGSRSFFADANAKLGALKREYDEAYESFQRQWGHHGSERRIMTEEAAIQQVASDPLYASGQPGYDSYILNQALDALDSIV